MLDDRISIVFNPCHAIIFGVGDGLGFRSGEIGDTPADGESFYGSIHCGGIPHVSVLNSSSGKDSEMIVGSFLSCSDNGWILPSCSRISPVDQII